MKNLQESEGRSDALREKAKGNQESTSRRPEKTSLRIQLGTGIIISRRVL